MSLLFNILIFSNAHTFLFVKIFLVCANIITNSTFEINASLKNQLSLNFDTILPVPLKNCSVVTLEEIYFSGLAAPRQPHGFTLSFSGISKTNSTSHFIYSPTSVRDVPRWRDPCSVAFIQVDDEVHGNNGDNLSSDNTTSIRFYEHVEALSGILRKDEDYFIFHSTNVRSDSLIDSIFSNDPLASNVKNKVGVKVRMMSSGSSSSLTAKTTTPLATSFSFFYVTTCIYCGSGGMPRVSVLNSLSFPDHLTNFHGKVFTVSCPMLSIWIYQIRPSSTPGKWVSARGNYKFAFDHLMLKYNFSGTFFPSTGGGTGLKLANGTWVGIVGDVLSGRAEIGQAIGQIYHRNLVVAFTFPISYEWLSFTTGMPQPHYSWKSVYWPFKPLLWWLVIVSVLLTFICLVHNLKVQDGGFETVKCFNYLLATFLEQDAREVGKSSSTRILIAFWLLFSILVTTAYRSKLVGLLSFPLLQEPPSSFKALAESSPDEYHIALQYLRGAAYTLIKTSTNPTFQTIFNRMELEESDAKCFQQAIGSTKHICISWDRIADFVNHKNLSDKYGNVPLKKAPDTTCFIVVGLALRKRAVFRQKFDIVLSLATSMGLTGKWVELDNEFVRNERTAWEKATNRTRVVYSEMSVIQPLRIENLTGALYLLICGIVLGLTGFVFERGFRGKERRLYCILSAFKAHVFSERDEQSESNDTFPIPQISQINQMYY